MKRSRRRQQLGGSRDGSPVPQALRFPPAARIYLPAGLLQGPRSPLTQQKRSKGKGGPSVDAKAARRPSPPRIA